MHLPSLYPHETMHPDICRNDNKPHPWLAGKPGIVRSLGTLDLSLAIAFESKKVGAA
ncbi:hypothetical protein ECAE60S_02823 [Eoetvoesiella caeni]